MSVTPRTVAAIWAGKAAGAASRILRRGGGTALPGLVAERLDPRLVERLGGQLGLGSVIVTGTNGKTTTAHMLSSVARAAGYRPLHNRTGSNLMRGIATALLADAGLAGSLPDADKRLGVFEVDEATLPQAVAALSPRALVFTNLFRDQLDRYGEVDSIAARWRATLKAAPPSTTVVLNSDDPSVAALEAVARGPVLLYGVEDAAAALSEPEHAADSRWCAGCGLEYQYEMVFYGHIGHWRCPGCSLLRREPEVRAESVRFDPAGETTLEAATPAGRATLVFKLGGLYNVYNALGAVAAALALHLPLDAVEKGIAQVAAAFGRQERFEVDGRQVQVLLAKNPTGLNQVLRMLAALPGGKHVLLLLNDDIADGRDVSWIWDADFELMTADTVWTVASGRRAEDLALRLKYAGLPHDLPVVKDAEDALDLALREMTPKDTLYVIPTYTAMLEVREILAKRGRTGHYWEENG
ncbi:MAG: MurT ligase domain-containing protein [Dehalococcoidia bacterium]|nr:MurT ligase domain-containing protein [Dehalococcoidia bacterium]